MRYAIITENDVSPWKDETGVRYHFPNKYKKLLTPGTQVIYYKGRILEKKFENLRLTSNPHYFGVGVIGSVYVDSNSKKLDLFATIVSFKQFLKGVEFKINGKLIESIPENRKSNYWFDGVRIIDKDTFDRIIELAQVNYKKDSSVFNDNETNDSALESTLEEGGKKKFYGTKYERRPALRQQAVEFHGLTCMACGFNFKDRYGSWGAGYIHVHHIVPLYSSQKPKKVNSKTDMVVLCANCHSMVHRRKDKLLSMDELKSILK